MSENAWIPVEQSLPKAHVRLAVIVADHRTIAPAWWIKDHFESYCHIGRRIHWVSKWMPFPTI